MRGHTRILGTRLLALLQTFSMIIFTFTGLNARFPSLDTQIPVAPGYPPGGAGYILWTFGHEFERLDVEIEILEFDTSKNFFLQLYQSAVGDEPFYFGIQNRAEEGDQMLIFSKWETKDLSHTRINADFGGFNQSAGYEGDFVGVRLPGFKLKKGVYTFALVREEAEENWYAFFVVEKSSQNRTWCGSILFTDPGKIGRFGCTWIELFGRPWPVQTYRYLPVWDIKIKSIRGDGYFPTNAASTYRDPLWGDHIPMKDIYYDVSKKSFRIRLGPDVIRKNSSGFIY